jgi:release factor glutamine methyltransferase
MYDYTKSLERSQLSRGRTNRPRRFDFDGREWILLPGVFSPADTGSTVAQLALLRFESEQTFLEIGCGTGVIAVSAALAGCQRVVAADVNPAAVANAAANAALFGVDAVVEPVHSDLFAGLPAGSKFDVIYWHSNNAWAPPHLEVNFHELAYVDPGYATHRRFLATAPDFLAPGGRILVGVSSRADRTALDELAQARGLGFRSVASASVDEPEGRIVYELLEAKPSPERTALAQGSQ